MFKNNIPLLLFSPIFLFQSSGAILEDVAEWEKPTFLTEEAKIGKGGAIVVDYYNVQDQCMPMPGYEWVFFNQLAFHLSAQGICEGHGLLLCYPGQLGGDVLAMPGLASANPFWLTNQRGNEVAERCEELRKKLGKGCGNGDEECPGKFGGGGDGWHGILMGTDKNGDILIRLSTTERTFLVPRNAIGEWLIIKLATAKKTISFLSQEFGPHRDLAQKHDGQEWMEKEGMVHVEEDTHLWKEYAKNIHKGVRMNKYAGIWSLGLDLLPIDGIAINFLVERSKCCEMDAWFLTPTSNKPPKFHQKLNKTSVNEQSAMMENMRIRNGTEHIFVCRLKKNGNTRINILLSDKLSKTSLLYWTIDLKKETIELLEKWPGKPSHHHYDSLALVSLSHDFRIKFTFWNDRIDFGVNCKNIIYKLNAPINFRSIFSYKFSDDFILVDTSGLSLPEFLKIAQTDGLLVRGKVPESNKEGVTIRLFGPIASGALPLVLDLRVDFKENVVIIKMEDDQEDKVRGSVLKSGEPFEIWIRFYCELCRIKTNLYGEYPMEVWMNNLNLNSACVHQQCPFESFSSDGIGEEWDNYYLQISDNIDEAKAMITESQGENAYEINLAGANNETNALTIEGKVLPTRRQLLQEGIVIFTLIEMDHFTNISTRLINVLISDTKCEINILSTGEYQALDRNVFEEGKNFVLRFYHNDDYTTLCIKINDGPEYRFRMRQKVIVASVLGIEDVQNPKNRKTQGQKPGHLLITGLTNAMEDDQIYGEWLEV